MFLDGLLRWVTAARGLLMPLGEGHLRICHLEDTLYKWYLRNVPSFWEEYLGEPTDMVVVGILSGSRRLVMMAEDGRVFTYCGRQERLYLEEGDRSVPVPWGAHGKEPRRRSPPGTVTPLEYGLLRAERMWHLRRETCLPFGQDLSGR